MASRPLIEVLPTKTPADFRQVMENRGWTPEMLSQRWGMSKRRIHQIMADADRPRYYDDAVDNLPLFAECENSSSNTR